MKENIIENNFIQLPKSNILKIGIKDEDGNPTGEYLEFDLESIEYPLKLNECERQHYKNFSNYQAQLQIINKKYNNQQLKNNGVLNKKQKEEVEAFNIFFKKEVEAIDLFLGEGGANKLLNGRTPYYSFFADFLNIAKSIMPLLKLKSEDIRDTITKKYKVDNFDEIEVLK